ncbi:hypothetical protein EXIGLDRAFT_843367 [Exidia glandulosa HHB12029]|uniref:Uncharacterized protein n=1 Tax=Exidia glandulosa HHB12029 TaxID=1314781 RepID=A0A165CQ79_EXIGL|nr:hypothetical protein EXIGLDRAFT_843367 [Exidia glandulosa HHB12029]
MSKHDFDILKNDLVNALSLVGGGRANADALTAYAALYIAELDAFYRDQKRVPMVLEAKAPVGLKEDARRGVESALLRLASRAFGGAGRTNLTSELEPYEAARRTLGIAKDETRKTLDYLVSLERRGPVALTPQPPPPAQTPMRKGSKRATAATPRRSPLRDVNANTVTESPVKKKSKKKAAPRSSGVTLQDQNAMAMLMSSTKSVDWTSRLTNNENEEKPRVVTGKPAGKRKSKVKATLKDESKRASVSVSASASVAPAPARAAAPAPFAVAVTAARLKTDKARSALSISKTGPSTST